MSTFRIATSTVRSVARRAAPANRYSAVRSAVRRGYASGSSNPGSFGAEKTSEMPWLIGSVGFTVPALAWLIYTNPSKGSSSKSAHKKHDAQAHEEHNDDTDEAPASSEEANVPLPDTSSPAASSSTEEEAASSSSSDSPPPSSTTPTSQLPGTTDANKAPTSPPGQQVNPAPVDTGDISEGGDETVEGKRRAKDEYKEMIRKKDTRVATSASDLPSKKTAGEGGREDS